MVDREKIMAKVREQAEKRWDSDSIRAWLRRLSTDGMPAKGIDPREAIQKKPEVLDMVQLRAEECTFLGRI